MSDRLHVISLGGKRRVERRGGYQRKRVGNNPERQRQRSNWLPVHLGVNHFRSYRLANQFLCLPRVDSSHAPQLPKPKRGEASEIAQPAGSRICDHLEMVLKQACAGSDFERAAIIRCSSDYDDRGAPYFLSATDIHFGETITEQLPKPFRPIRDDSHAFLQPFIHSIYDGTVRVPRRPRRGNSVLRVELPWSGFRSPESQRPERFAG